MTAPIISSQHGATFQIGNRGEALLIMSQGVCFCLDPFLRIEGVLIRGQWRRGRESLAVAAGDEESRSVCLEGDCVCVECIHGAVSVYACGMCVCVCERE